MDHETHDRPEYRSNAPKIGYANVECVECAKRGAPTEGMTVVINGVTYCYGHAHLA
jgi:hypothetical protein